MQLPQNAAKRILAAFCDAMSHFIGVGESSSRSSIEPCGTKPSSPSAATRMAALSTSSSPLEASLRFLVTESVTALMEDSVRALRDVRI